jgi:hypothetical protein
MADGIRRIRESEICRIADVSRSTRIGWQRRGAIEGPKDGGFEERHVVETAIFACISSVVEPAVAQAAWLDVRDDVLSTALKGPSGKLGRLDALINVQTAALELVGGYTEIGRILHRRHGQHHVIVRLTEPVNDARRAFLRFARPPLSPGA